MNRQTFSDGIGQITITGGTVRLDFVAFSPTEKDANGQPAAVFCQRIIMSPDGFLQSAQKIQEAMEALSKLPQLARQPTPAHSAVSEPVSARAEASAGASAAPAKRPFP
jgi:hypothetical protein